MTLRANLSNLKTVIASGANGRKFSVAEDTLICKLVSDALKKSETVSVASIRTAVAKMNTDEQLEARTRAAVSNAIDRLAKAGKLDKAGIANENNGRTQYTEAEDKVIIDAIMKADKEGKQVTLPELHEALKASGVSPKERTLPSVRAHVTNLLEAPKADSKDSAAG